MRSFSRMRSVLFSQASCPKMAATKSCRSACNSRAHSSTAARNIADFWSEYHTKEDHHKHTKNCTTCTTEKGPSTADEASVNSETRQKVASMSSASNGVSIHRFACGNPQHEDEYNELPPPLPEPTYSVHMRQMPDYPLLTALNSREGRHRLLEALQDKTAETYFPLTEQFLNQSDPAYCGVTTLLVVLNAMSVDPNVRWKGGWRWYGDEDVLFDRCCLSRKRIQRVGISCEEFRLMSRCNGLSVELKRPMALEPDDRSEDIVDNHHRRNFRESVFDVEDFRSDIREVLSESEQQAGSSQGMLVTSFSRAALGQTGDGHFSPIAAYHKGSDSVLVLDVARFKYPPYWVSVQTLYEAMRPLDGATQRPRGWFRMWPPQGTVPYLERHGEDRRPVELVPLSSDPDVCPVGSAKVEYCPGNSNDGSG